MTRNKNAASLVFVCAECGSRIGVDEAVRETLIADGCVVCDSPVSANDFE